MLKRDEVSDPTSCLNKAADDEPVFVIRAKDRVGPATVRDWVYRATALGIHQEKVAEALDLARAMEVWRRAHPPEAKVPA